MKTTNEFTIVVEYNSDPTKMIDDHNSEPIFLTQVNDRRFRDIFEAIKFLSECTNPITKIEEIVHIKKPKGFKFILPERNIKIKHQVDNVIDSKFTLDDEDWG